MLTNQNQAILNYAQENSQFKAKEIQVLLDLKPSRTRKLLSELCDKELLKKYGVNIGTYYTIGNK